MDHLRRRLLICVLFSLFYAPVAVSATPADLLADPVIIRGDKLDGLIGESPAGIRVFAYGADGFTLVPFQVDERMEVSAYKSWTTRTRVLTYAFDRGPKAQPDPDPTFDRDDELVFMAFSAGERANGGGPPRGAETCEEVVLNLRDGGAAYVYACSMKKPGPLSEKRFVREETDDSIESIGYSVGFHEGNPVNFHRLQTREGDELNPDVVDRFKLKVEVLIGYGIATYPLTDDDFQHYLRGVRAGSVRVIKEFESVLETWAGAQIRTYNHVYFYPRHFEYDMLFRGAANWGKNFNRSHLEMAIDLDEGGRGMSFHSDKNLAGVRVDGYTSPAELHMDYGPARWAAVSGNAGTLMVYMGLDRGAELYKDLFYADNEVRGDPPEEAPGMIGKFGYVIRDLQKAGFDAFPVRFAVYPRGAAFQEGMADPFVNVYSDPLKVELNRHQLWAVNPDAPPVPDTREEKPKSIFAEQKRGLMIARFIAPSFLYDPNLLGSGPGIGYTDIDFLGTGTYFGFFSMWSDRGYATYEVTFSELRFIKNVESFRVSLRNSSFPAEPYYGVGNDTDKDHRTLYWWNRDKVEVKFSKYFGGIYGSEFQFQYEKVGLDSGIQPLSGEGTPSIEERFGKDGELKGERWGPPVYGMEGGNMSRVRVELYRDMRNAKYLPKYGNYQGFHLDAVNSILGADYDFVKAGIDLRSYWHPDFLNPLPFWDETVNPRRTFLTKFFGPDKNRAFASRIQIGRIFAEEIDFRGREILDVPFYELNYIGSSHTVKGFSSKRFRDNDMFVGSVEYRWRWWKFQDMALFYDIGLVMEDMLVREDWGGPWHHGYGISWRIHKPPHVIVTFEFAWSIENQAMQHQMNVAF